MKTSLLILACLLLLTNAEIKDTSAQRNLDIDLSHLESDYAEAKRDFDAANVEKKQAAADRVLSTKLQARIDRIELNEVKIREDAHSIQLRLASLQMKIKLAKAKQAQMAQAKAEMVDKEADLQKFKQKESQTHARFNKEASWIKSREIFEQNEKIRIEASANMLMSKLGEANLRVREFDRSRKELSSYLDRAAYRLKAQEARAVGFEKRGVELRKASQLASVNPRARMIRDDSMYDFAKALLLTNKASRTRKQLEKLSSDLQKSKRNENDSLAELAAQRNLLKHEFIDLDEIRRDSNVLDSDYPAVEKQGEHVSQLLNAVNAAIVHSHNNIQRISKQEQDTTLPSSFGFYERLMNRYGSLKQEGKLERESLVNDFILNRRLHRAAAMHVRSEKRLDRAANDAANSAVKLLDSASILTSIESKR